MSSPLPAGLSAIAASPEIYPHALDPTSDRIWFTRLTRRQFDDASFLDERAPGGGRPGEWVPVAVVEAVARELPERCAFLFHTGHVGSTLMSRLLGALPGLFSLREPTPLLALAQAAFELDQPEALWTRETFEARLSLMLQLWSRPFSGGELPVVKATSWASELAPTLLTRASRPRAIAMSVQPDVYLAGVLASPGAWDDARNTAQTALRRLHVRLGEPVWRLHAMSPGERVAMSWACEMSVLAAARAAAPEAFRWLDFEAFLAAPAEHLATAASHLGVPADPSRVEALTSGPLMTHYSKQPGLGFDAAFRRRVVDHARATQADEIARGLAWLDDAARRFPVIAAAREEL